MNPVTPLHRRAARLVMGESLMHWRRNAGMNFVVASGAALSISCSKTPAPRPAPNGPATTATTATAAATTSRAPRGEDASRDACRLPREPLRSVGEDDCARTQSCEKRCKAGVAAACVAFGSALATGKDVVRNDERAVVVLDDACRARICT
jgi:hypothetical protein